MSDENLMLERRPEFVGEIFQCEQSAVTPERHHAAPPPAGWRVRSARGVTAGALCAMLMATPTAALAYVGPGASLTAIGVLIALVAAVVLAVVGFVWYPLKRLLRGRSQRAAQEHEEKTRQRTSDVDDNR